MNNRQREVTYHCTYTKKYSDEMLHYYSKRIVKMRAFIKNNKEDVLACWKRTETKTSAITERIYRKLEQGEPKEYYNNKIKA